jgi:hypothetical protein
MPAAGFEAAVTASELPQTHALGGAATGIGTSYMVILLFRSYMYGVTPMTGILSLTL